MIVIMERDAPIEQTQAVIAEVSRQGYTPHPIYGDHLNVVAVVGKHPGSLRGLFESMPGVDHVQLIDQSYKLVARADREPTQIRVRDVVIGGDELVVMAGPCSVESEEQLMTVARAVKAAGAQILRGGAFKPRSSPYSFMGLGKRGLELLAQAREETGLPIVSEVMDPRRVELLAEYVDMMQIGARNMQNFTLLSEVGQTRIPILLKRGLSATIDELLNAAEYVAAEGNDHVLLCERGIRTFETATRNTLDISAVPVLKKMTHLPVAIDPSHATGERDYVAPMACAAAAAGADALMIEIHPEPGRAMSDGGQSLTLPEFDSLMAAVRQVPRFRYR